MPVYFCNKEPMDITLAKTFGVSAKDNNNPIGYFGTGLKYAIAIILREGGQINISVKGKDHKFSIKDRTIRDKSFNFVYCNNRPLAYTTELGKNWELWEAFRELYSNMLDEGGICTTDINDIKNFATVIEVVDVFDDIFYKKDKYFIREQHHNNIISSSVYGQVIQPSDEDTIGIYYRGIYTEGSGAILFSYNIEKEQLLTENRSFRYGIDGVLTKLIAQIQNKEIWDKILNSSNSKEHYLVHNWLDIVELESNPHLIEIFEPYYKTSPQLLPDTVFRYFRNLNKEREDCRDSSHQKVLDEALLFLSKIGFDIKEKIVVIEADRLTKMNTLAFTDGTDIFLYKRIFDHGFKYVVHGILEEHIHINERINDETYEFQNYLFNKWLLAEAKLIGEII